MQVASPLTTQLKTHAWTFVCFHVGVLLALSSQAQNRTANVAHLPPLQSAESVVSAFKAKGKKVVTFVGYSGAEYQDKARMLAQAKAALSKLDPSKTVVNIGATPDGIGEVYKIAKAMGFETTGIVSAKSRTSGTLSPFVDHVFFVQDDARGGFRPGTHDLTPTSQAMVGASDQVIGIGGGAVGRDELIASREAGKTVTFIPADMNHDIALQKAAQAGTTAPTDFGGAAASAFSSKSDCVVRALENLVKGP